jgi:hypothetical protein
MSLPNGLDLRPRHFRRWCLAEMISTLDNPIASNGQAAPQLSCPVVGRFYFWLPRALGSQFFQDPRATGSSLGGLRLPCPAREPKRPGVRFRTKIVTRPDLPRNLKPDRRIGPRTAAPMRRRQRGPQRGGGCKGCASGRPYTMRHIMRRSLVRITPSCAGQGRRANAQKDAPSVTAAAAGRASRPRQ